MKRTIVALLAFAFLGQPCLGQCPGDIVPTGNVNGNDLGELLAAWGPCGACPADIDGNGAVDGNDLGILLGAWGPCLPYIASVSPNQGSTAGGATVSINGNYFLGATQVKFGNNASPSIQIVSGTLVTAVVPPGSAGTVNVTVTALSGSGTRSGAFSYVQPSISSVSPEVGATTGGALVLISGAYLQQTSAVWFGKTPASSFTQVSSSQVLAVAPPGTTGSVAVRLSTPSGMLTSPTTFTYVTMVVPAWASAIELEPDPAIVTRPDLRAAIRASGYAWRVRDAATQIEMVLIPPGTFTMGCSPSLSGACNSDENPPHVVTLTSPFYMGRYEVTQGQWLARMGSNPSYYQGPSYPNWATLPVEQVSWNSVQTFMSATGMRLPTEAEWERAYRAGTTTAYHGFAGMPDGTNDDGQLHLIAWQNDSGGTRAVGQKLGNGFGLHDMSGNVDEWVNDRYSSTYYASSPSINPPGHATITNRARRGGEFTDAPSDCRASVRGQALPSSSFPRWGFRAARNP
jgi:formylglycine-generating enzyme required for sulfatase activity